MKPYLAHVASLFNLILAALDLDSARGYELPEVLGWRSHAAKGHVGGYELPEVLKWWWSIMGHASNNNWLGP
jgi:hypothetical protein